MKYAKKVKVNVHFMDILNCASSMNNNQYIAIFVYLYSLKVNLIKSNYQKMGAFKCINNIQETI